jgi:hypothetical protein
LGAGGGEDEVAADLAALGAPAEVIEAERAAPAEVVEVWEESREPWLLWVDVQTQWRSGWEGMITGLDYAGVMAVCRWKRIKTTPDLFADLRVMEAATLEALAERRDRDRDRR